MLALYPVSTELVESGRGRSGPIKTDRSILAVEDSLHANHYNEGVHSRSLQKWEVLLTA